MNAIKFFCMLSMLFLVGCSASKSVKPASVMLAESSPAIEESPTTEEAQKAALNLLDSIGMSEMMDEMIDQVLDMELQRSPGMAPYKGTLIKFFEKHLSYESLRMELASIYADHFTESELVQLTEFNSTALGQKSQKVMPTLYRLGAELGMSRVQDNLDELKAMIEEESKRIQNLQNQP